MVARNGAIMKKIALGLLALVLTGATDLQAYVPFLRLQHARVCQGEGCFNAACPRSSPNVTGGCSGNAPDLGALETGQPMPHYGLRLQNQPIFKTKSSRENHVQET